MHINSKCQSNNEKLKLVLNVTTESFEDKHLKTTVGMIPSIHDLTFFGITKKKGVKNKARLETMVK